MPRFPSAGWADALRDALNSNPAYESAAKAWEGDFLLVLRPDAEAPEGLGVHLDLHHGRCRSATFVQDPRNVRSEFVFEGSRTDWIRLLRRELDPIQALMNGTFTLRGNMMKAMRFTRAAKEMLDTAAGIPRDGE